MSALTSLLEGYLPSPEAPQTYQITLPEGEPITCRKISSYRDLVDYKEGLSDFWLRCQRLEVDKDARDLVPATEAEARAAFTLIFNSCEPTKFTDRDAFLMLRAPWVMDRLIAQINQRQNDDLAEARLAWFDRAKKDSERTDGNETGSSNPGTPSDNTPAT